MLRNEIYYRLGRFILIERKGITLSWITHSPFGCQRSGRCYLLGNILVLLPCDHEEPGYLKLEFHEYSRKLPPWTKTTYYCFAASLMRIGMLQSFTRAEIKIIANNRIGHTIVGQIEPNSYQLYRYQITINNDLAISWHTIDGLNQMVGGSSYLESDIIFLGPPKAKLGEGQRREFFTGLKRLPFWNKSVAWGYAESLSICEE